MPLHHASSQHRSSSTMMPLAGQLGGTSIVAGREDTASSGIMTRCVSVLSLPETQASLLQI